MSTKKTIKKAPAKLAASKAKPPKFKLISYTLGAVIPTGAYANIQPSITIEADTIENAERILMSYMETLITKYRSDGSSTATKPVVTQPQATKAPETPVKPQAEAKEAPATKAEVPAPKATAEAPIVLTVPFNRAKTAIESCMSAEALKLVTDQITKSTRLTPEEKNTLIMQASDKSKALNGQGSF